MIPGSAEHIEHLGSENATVPEKLLAVTNCGQCLICGEEWAPAVDALRSCPHDEIQVIAMLRGQLADARAAEEKLSAAVAALIKAGDSLCADHGEECGECDDAVRGVGVACASLAAWRAAVGPRTEHCGQCGQPYAAASCGPTHVAIKFKMAKGAPYPRDVLEAKDDDDFTERTAHLRAEGSHALVIDFTQDPDGRWSATASGIATGKVSGTATQGKALHALAYLLNFPSL